MRRASGTFAWMLALALLAWSHEPYAQADRDRRRCLASDPPFATSLANQIKGPEISRMLADKSIVALRRSVGGGAPELEGRFGFAFRADGSVLFTCQTHRGPGAPWEPCRAFNPDTAGSRDVGVWRVEGDVLIVQRTRFGESEARVTLHRQGNVYAFARLTTAHLCLPGPITVQ